MVDDHEHTHWVICLLSAVLVPIVVVIARRFWGSGGDLTDDNVDLGDGDGGGGWRTQMAAARQRQQLEYWSVGNRRAREQAALRREKLLSEIV